MTKAELVTAIAARAGLDEKQAKRALEAFTASVTASLKAGHQVRVVGFGSFVPIDRSAGVSRNPKTGAPVARAASRTARFRVGETLKSALN
ncbi:MAG: HU family DNA-binding protein [Caulobacteraceae bacterium]|nr:HU family DNA-binding protein [Caulobacteraceae bacterium]